MEGTFALRILSVTASTAHRYAVQVPKRTRQHTAHRACRAVQKSPSYANCGSYKRSYKQIQLQKAELHTNSKHQETDGTSVQIPTQKTGLPLDTITDSLTTTTFFS